MDTSLKQQTKPTRKQSFFAWLFLTWTIPLFLKGARQNLVIADLDSPSQAEESERIADALEREWELEDRSGKEKSTRKPSLLRAIIRVFWLPFMVIGLFQFIGEVIFRLIQPWLQKAVMEYFTQNDSNVSVTKTNTYLNTIGLVGITFAIMLLWHHTSLSLQRLGMRIRVGCCSLVYRKVLRLDLVTIGDTAVGRIVNLLSNDVSRFDKVLLCLHSIWIMPIQVVAFGYVMWQYVGVSAVIGITVVIVQTIPLQGYLSTVSARLREKTALKTDIRVQFVSEMIANMQAIKMYAWEKPFEIMVTRLRAAEMNLIGRASNVKAYYCGAMDFTEKVNLYCTLVSFVLMGNSLTPECVFVLITFFNIIQTTSAIGFPLSLIQANETRVSIRRLEEFLTLPEVQSVDDSKTLKIDEAMPQSGESGLKRNEGLRIEMHSVSANWAQGQTSPTLYDVSMVVESGSLCCLVGPVGAGKSSLLHLILGELPISSGILKFCTDAGTNRPVNRCEFRLSYCSQDPWLFSGTIRDNILFGQPYDEKRYVEVTNVCALRKDFEQLPHGDLSFVGERGSALSGGQKTRVNLARAIYMVADIYVFDDVFSAVDTRVGQHLFHECIKGYLRDTTRVIVTHQPRFLQHMDTVVLLNRGSVISQGSFDDLTRPGFSFLKRNEQDDIEDDVIEEKNEGVLAVGDQVSTTSPTQTTSLDYEEHANSSDGAMGTNTTSHVVGTKKLINNVYSSYFGAGGNVISITLLGICYVAGQVALSGVDYWLSFWTDEQISTVQFNATISVATTNETFIETLWHDEQGLLKPEAGIYIYTMVIISCIILVVLRSLWFMNNCMNSSRHIHNSTFAKLFRTKMTFFDTTPSGRILNRFSKDVGTMDELIPESMMEGIQGFLILMGIIVLIVIANYWMVVPIVVTGVILCSVIFIHTKTVQDVKRLEGIAKSPIFSHVDSTISGLATVRSRTGMMTHLRKDFDRYQDIHTAAWFATISTAVTFGFVIDVVTCILIGCVCVLFISNDVGTTTGSTAGLAISQSLMLIGMVQWGVRRNIDVLSQMTAVERILQYRKLPQEGPYTTSSFTTTTWPTKGSLKFRGVSMKYSERGPLMLKNVTVEMQPGWKVGIVGRTGAGKSSLISALFRMYDDGLTGEIFIDNVDIKSIGLHEVRSKISIIPQQPVLFSASLRYNLDPHEQYSDSQLWDCLKAVELDDAVSSLDYQVVRGGTNFSMGQRQLICLARAVLRKNRILVLDEATANIDPHTDVLIQNTIRRKFADCTVLTVAHRLNTIMDSDRVLVMEQGCVMEFDHPHVLLQKPDSWFSQIVRQTGNSAAKKLARLAEHTYISGNDAENDRDSCTRPEDTSI